MACQLQPECNFLHRFFKCKLPMEVVDMESQSHVYARDPLVQKRSDHAGNQNVYHGPITYVHTPIS